MGFMFNIKVIGIFVSLFLAKLLVFISTNFVVSLVIPLMFTFTYCPMVLHIGSGKIFCGNKNR